MVPLVMLGLGGLLATKLWKQYKKPATTTPKGSTIVAQTLAQPPSAPGQLTPERVAVHGDLMRRCNDPRKLKQAAALFGHEGLPFHSTALLQKAAMIHEMMHGAADIVERSRAGDQHAMALAKSIGEQARAGNKRAKLSWILIEDYTKRHPPGEKPAENEKAA
jgi:hypothetical protein